MKRSSFIFILILLIASLFFVVYYHTAQHEAAHQAIWKYYGIQSKIELHNPIYAFKHGGEFGTAFPLGDTSSCDETCTMLSMQNEIFSYNMQSVIIAMFAFAFLILLIFALKDDTKEVK